MIVIKSYDVMESFGMENLTSDEFYLIEGGASCSTKKWCLVYCDNYTPCNHIPGEGCNMWGMSL